MRGADGGAGVMPWSKNRDHDLDPLTRKPYNTVTLTPGPVNPQGLEQRSGRAGDSCRIAVMARRLYQDSKARLKVCVWGGSECVWEG